MWFPFGGLKKSSPIESDVLGLNSESDVFETLNITNFSPKIHD